jgi:hypothetical protein
LISTAFFSSASHISIASAVTFHNMTDISPFVGQIHPYPS